jgi:hypothetical protein
MYIAEVLKGISIGFSKAVLMISVKSTPSLAGVEISGGYDDFDSLYDAISAITDEQLLSEYPRYQNVAIRLLGFSYDLRHAMQGDREIALVDNGMTEELMAFHHTIAPRSNVVYRFNYLYPEMMFVTLAINCLAQLRVKKLAKTAYPYFHDKQIIWDDALTTLRSFQAKFARCVRDTLPTPGVSARWHNTLIYGGASVEGIVDQYVDMLNITYLKLNKDKRLKELSRTSRRIAEYYLDEEHHDMKGALEAAAKESGCDIHDLNFTGLEYPDNIEW